MSTTTKPTAVAAWRARMGLSQRAAAQALGLSLSAYQEHERGASFDGRPREPSRVILLACAALEHGLDPVGAEAIGAPSKRR